MNKRFTLKLIAACAMLVGASGAFAQNTIKIANIVELSGAGATSGTNFKNGVEMAIKEINAAGGILGKKIESTTSDTQTNPGVAKGLTQKAVDEDVFSGSIMVSMAESRKAGIPNFTGGEAAAITQQGNPYVFRTSFGQAQSFPKLGRYIADGAKLKTLAVIYVNNDFGKGGLDNIKKALANTNTKIVSEISTDSGQVDFSAAVLKAKQSGADGVFSYSNEEESARILRELRKQGWTKPVIGETVLTSQKVIELAGDAANGAVGHVGLTVDAPNPEVLKFKAKYYQEYKYISDHNGIKGYTGVYIMKAAIEKVGKLDRKAFADAMHGLVVSAKKNPGVLMDVAFDQNGDMDRESYLTEVVGGKQAVTTILPAINPSVFGPAAAPAAAKPAKK
jgi:branched-chain amino acid transport system substrate-binding protein